MSHIENDSLREQEYEQQQEEAHQHFIIQEFAHLVKSVGVEVAFADMDKDARDMIAKYFYTHVIKKLTDSWDTGSNKKSDPISDVLTISTRGY